MIDGKLIDPSEYTTSGSKTDAALSPDLLKRLSEGEHTIMFVYNDGWASGTFLVAGDHGDQYNAEEESHADNSGPFPSKSMSPLTGSPLTGDSAADHIPMRALLIMISLAGVVVVKTKISEGR